MPKHFSHQIRVVIFALAGGMIVMHGISSADEKSAPAQATSQPNPATGSIAPKPTCTVSKEDFAKWFQSGSVTPDGLVTPADSLKSLDTLCDFYRWSWRMFLWQTSKTQSGVVFNSPPFFDLNENNELISNKPGVALKMGLRGGKFQQAGRTGQAGIISGVLMTQPVGVNSDGSLIYYAIHVNDVLGYMASGVNSGSLSGVTQFPTTDDQRDAIVNYAQSAYGVKIADGNTLAMELKSSWVRLTDVMDAKTYITVKSDIPKYVKQDAMTWTWDGTTVESGVTLACVGYHLVGSAKGHPEMIWATFEHSKNAPDDNFYYVNKDGATTLHRNWNDDGTPLHNRWLLMDGKSKKQSMNQMHMELLKHNIVAVPDKTVSPGNTMRTHPWGGLPSDQGSAENNTAILSLNENMASMLVVGDVRRNYHLIGATWTKNGVPGVGLQLPVVAGSLVLSNATMETYLQFKNCFDCHQGGKINGLSHIFGGIKPLPQPRK